MRKLTVVLSLALAVSAGAFAQNAPRPAFEVASVRLWSPGTRGGQSVTDTRVALVNVPLRSVLLTAFRAKPYQLSAPDWVNDVRVDIQATLPAGATRAQVPEMLQTLLRERFGLVTHTEPRPVQAYELVVGKEGMKMREVEPVDELTKAFPPDPSLKSPPPDTVSETVNGSVRTMMIPIGVRTVTARSMYERVFSAQRTTQINAARIAMAEFADLLASNIDAPVIDRTGLAGVYQFTIELPADASAVRMLLSMGTTATVQGTPLTDPTAAVSAFKAIEALGLKLEERKAPIAVIVVDKIERTPTEN